MATFYEGDHVRLGVMRGGIVVRHEGQLKVRFPFASKLVWLDYCVPDEGPHGQIFPNSWDPCEICGNPATTPRCVNCRARDQREALAFDRAERRRENAEAIANGEPTFAIHVAGPVIRDGRRITQACARCQAVLHAYIGDVEIGLFPEGTLVERGGLGLSTPPFSGTQPTCRPVVQRPAALRKPA